MANKNSSNGIGKRVTIGFMSIVVLLFAAGMISLSELGNMSTDAEQILTAGSHNIEFANKLFNLAHSHDTAVMHATLFGNRNYYPTCDSVMESLKVSLAQLQEASKPTPTLDSLASAILMLEQITQTHLYPNGRDSLPVMSQLHSWEHFDEENDAQIWYDMTYEVSNAHLIEAIRANMTQTHLALQPRAAQLNLNAYRAVTPVFISLLVMIAIVLMLYYFIYIYCVRPIVKINKALKEFIAFRVPYTTKAEKICEIKELDTNLETITAIVKHTSKDNAL